MYQTDGFDYVINYKKDKDNKATNALSRLPAATCSTLSLSQPQWDQDIIYSHESDISP